MDKKDLKIVTSDGGELGKAGREKWLKNILEFAAPPLLMYIGFITVRVQADGFQREDVFLSDKEIGAVMLWVLNVAYDFLKKYIRPQAYIVEKK